MRSIHFAGAALLGCVSIVVACGTDNQSSPNATNIPTNSECPVTKLHPLAIGVDSLLAKELPAMTLALTFDSGPSASTEAIETYLAQQQIHATFFITGENVSGLETTLAQTSADGHLIGNRGDTDDDMTMMTSDVLIKSITDTDTLIGTLTPAGKLYFRPPYGSWNQADQTAIGASPMNKYTGPVGWDIGDDLDPTTGSDSDCFAPDTGTAKTPQQCGDLYIAQIKTKTKGIVLMHDGPDETAAQTSAMIQYMVPLLKNQGYKFARMDELELVPESSLATGDDDTGTTTTDADGGVVTADPSDDPCKTH